MVRTNGPIGTYILNNWSNKFLREGGCWNRPPASVTILRPIRYRLRTIMKSLGMKKNITRDRCRDGPDVCTHSPRLNRADPANRGRKMTTDKRGREIRMDRGRHGARRERTRRSAARDADENARKSRRRRENSRSDVVLRLALVSTRKTIGGRDSDRNPTWCRPSDVITIENHAVLRRRRWLGRARLQALWLNDDEQKKKKKRRTTLFTHEDRCRSGGGGELRDTLKNFDDCRGPTRTGYGRRALKFLVQTIYLLVWTIMISIKRFLWHRTYIYLFNWSNIMFIKAVVYELLMNNK